MAMVCPTGALLLLATLRPARFPFSYLLLVVAFSFSSTAWQLFLDARSEIPRQGWVGRQWIYMEHGVRDLFLDLEVYA